MTVKPQLFHAREARLTFHFHLVLRTRPDVVATWSDDEVARRWLMLCPKRRNSDGTPAEPTGAEIRSIAGLAERRQSIYLSSIHLCQRFLAEDPLRRRLDKLCWLLFH